MERYSNFPKVINVKGTIHSGETTIYYNKVSTIHINTEITKLTPEQMKEFLWLFGDDFGEAEVKIGELDSFGYVKTIIVD